MKNLNNFFEIIIKYKKMKVTVDKTKCIGCGACASIEPAVFRINPEDGKSEADQKEVVGREQACKEAAGVCPVLAIMIEE